MWGLEECVCVFAGKGAGRSWLLLGTRGSVAPFPALSSPLLQLHSPVHSLSSCARRETERTTTPMGSGASRLGPLGLQPWRLLGVVVSSLMTSFKMGLITVRLRGVRGGLRKLLQDSSRTQDSESQPPPPSDLGVQVPSPSSPGIQESRPQPSEQMPTLGSYF